MLEDVLDYFRERLGGNTIDGKKATPIGPPKRNIQG